MTVDRWWQSFFDAPYAELLTQHAGDKIDRTVDFIIQALSLAPGATVLDQCCGLGRLSVPLAARDIEVIGVDQSADYIRRAEEVARAAGAACDFHVADAFEFVAPRACDGALNWFTSCGYHEDDDVNLRMFQRAFDSLKPGGWYAIDFVQTAWMLRDLQRSMIERREEQGGELIILMETRLDFERGMFEGTWTWCYPDGRREVRHMQNRAYLPHDFFRLLRRCGFVDLQLFGDIDGSDFTIDSPRTIVVGRRPG